MIGLTSTREKAQWLETEVGYDRVIDRETQPHLANALSAAAPEGIDIFFDNVGGNALNIAMGQLREQARLVLCGAISQYESAVEPLTNSWELITKRARMEGFMFSDYVESFPAIAEDIRARRLLNAMIDRIEAFHLTPGKPRPNILRNSGKGLNII